MKIRLRKPRVKEGGQILEEVVWQEGTIIGKEVRIFNIKNRSISHKRKRKEIERKVREANYEMNKRTKRKKNIMRNIDEEET